MAVSAMETLRRRVPNLADYPDPEGQAALAAFERLLAAAEKVVQVWGFREDDEVSETGQSLARAVRECREGGTG